MKPKVLRIIILFLGVYISQHIFQPFNLRSQYVWASTVLITASEVIELTEEEWKWVSEYPPDKYHEALELVREAKRILKLGYKIKVDPSLQILAKRNNQRIWGECYIDANKNVVVLVNPERINNLVEALCTLKHEDIHRMDLLRLLQEEPWLFTKISRGKGGYGTDPITHAELEVRAYEGTVNYADSMSKNRNFTYSQKRLFQDYKRHYKLQLDYWKNEASLDTWAKRLEGKYGKGAPPKGLDYYTTYYAAEKLPSINDIETGKFKVDNPKHLIGYALAVRGYLGEVDPRLKNIAGAWWMIVPEKALPRYIADSQRALMRDPILLLPQYDEGTRKALQAVVTKQLERRAQAFHRAQGQLIIDNRHRTILRARKLARQAQGNADLQKLMVRLYIAKRITDFLRTWYDGGWDALGEEVLDFITVDVPVAATTAAIGAYVTPKIVAYLSLNYPTVLAALQISGSVMTGAFVVVALYGIIENVVYVANDYFVLEPTRKELINTIYPAPEKSWYYYDFWAFYKKFYREDITSYKQMYKIAERWDEKLPTMTFATDGDRLVGMLVGRYRQWLIKNYQNYPEATLKATLRIRNLTDIIKSFKDDPKIWSVIANDLYRKIYISWKVRKAINAIKEKQEEAENAYFAKPLPEVPKGSKVIIKGIRPLEPNLLANVVPLNPSGTLQHGRYVFKAKQPMVVRPGSNIDLDVEYIVFGLPGEELRITIEPRVMGLFSSLRLRPFTKRIEFDVDKLYRVEHARISLPMNYSPERGKDEILTLQLDLSIGKQRAAYARIHDAVRLLVKKGPESQPDKEKPRTEPVIVGKWDWFNGAKVTVNPGNTMTATMDGKRFNSGKWRLVDPRKRIFILKWDQGGWTDKLTLSSDGKKLGGKNQLGYPVRATRIGK